LANDDDAPHPAIEHHDKAAEQLSTAADLHEQAAEAHRAGEHDEAAEHSAKARQATLNAAVTSDTAANLSAVKSGA
jgi:hypothetical protein